MKMQSLKQAVQPFGSPRPGVGTLQLRRPTYDVTTSPELSATRRSYSLGVGCAGSHGTACSIRKVY
eukprot:COSAG01_NODE_5704_length_4086_cov_24.512415_3_plen_66_part_00